MLYALNKCKLKETYEHGQHYYNFTGKCIVTGKTVTVKVKGEELFAYQVQGKLIQDALKSNTPEEREFLMSGISGEGWNKTFKEEED